MDVHDRLLYHQIHPLKLATDISTAVVAAVAFWHHALLSGALVGFLPSLGVTLGLLRWGTLEPYAHSPFGRYVASFMTRRVEGARLLGLVPLWGGAWARQPTAMAFGALWILACWLWGWRGRWFAPARPPR